MLRAAAPGRQAEAAVGQGKCAPVITGASHPLAVQAVRVTESYLNGVKRGGGTGAIDVKVYCKLGHMHLLLENYARGR